MAAGLGLTAGVAADRLELCAQPLWRRACPRPCPLCPMQHGALAAFELGSGTSKPCLLHSDWRGPPLCLGAQQDLSPQPGEGAVPCATTKPCDRAGFVMHAGLKLRLSVCLVG